MPKRLFKEAMICSTVICLFVSRSFLPLHKEEGVRRVRVGMGVGRLLPVKFEASASRSRLINLQWEFIQPHAGRRDLSKSESSLSPTRETRLTVTQ